MLADQQRLNNALREAGALAEMKRLLGFPLAAAVAPSSLAPSAAAALMSTEEEAVARDVHNTYGLSMEAVDAYLLRYLRSKHLNVEEAVVKLRRRRLFESTLPMITVTPTTVAALRKDLFHLLDRDLEGRPVLYINAAAPTLLTIEMDEAQRLLIVLLEFMQAQCLLSSNEKAAELQRRHPHKVDVSAPSSRLVASSERNEKGASTVGRTIHDRTKEAPGHLQQFTLLINEEGARWAMQASFLKNCSTLLKVLTKYYPHMLGTILVLGTSAEIRAAIQMCVSSSPDDLRSSVQMIERADLPRYMDVRTIPVELGGHKQVNGSAMNFSEAVLRHWFTLTSLMEDERLSGNGISDPIPPTTIPVPVAGPAGEACVTEASKGSAGRIAALSALPRPLYIPPPPLSTTQRRISRQRYTMELQHLSNSCDGVAGGISRLGSPEPRRLNDPVSNSITRNHEPSLWSPAGTVNATRTIRRLHGTPEYQEDMDAVEMTARTPHPNDQIDDGVCSTLSRVDDDDYANVPSPLASAVPTCQLYTAASSLAASLTIEDDMQPSDLRTGHHVHHSAPSGNGAPSITMSREEAARLTAHPEDAIVVLRQERQRRQYAEQALQFRDLGVVLDMQNASTIERELGAMHQDLNVLVAEILVKVEAAAKRHNTPPTLNQLLDLTLIAFENATRTPSTVPAMALAEPMQREAASSSCCNFM
ncbi:hypothetical protein JKF63_04430 [Porcisia hertigi]|uniref:CRAL-TRIO domain-containing protein n=1 Tax=Porcisia hertigi TaxID=2761500 RepID=A0A836LI21_9TRYP|nr:hypothetical protein JKF63_04430 [Porcisia hertigi]